MSCPTETCEELCDARTCTCEPCTCPDCNARTARARRNQLPTPRRAPALVLFDQEGPST